MSVAVAISGGNRDTLVAVTPSGELVVGPVAYDLTEFNELAEDNTAYNFFEPLPGKQFVITGFLAQGDQQITANASANVVIYEAADTGTITVDRVLIQFAITRSQAIPAIGLRTLVRGGKFVNAKTDDDDVHMTLMGYYINEL